MGTPRALAAGLACALIAACGSDAPDGEGAPAGVVNVYSHRHYETDKELFRSFTSETGIEVNVVTASADELIVRLENEGRNSPADLLITVDAGRLHRAAERGLLQPVSSRVLERNVPASLRDPEGRWVALTRRARVIAYARDRVEPGEVASYDDLADPRWRGRVLVRSSENVYNQSLLAAIIAHRGEERAREWAEGVVANMARSPSGGDTDQLKALAGGAGDLALVNSYYLARLAESGDAEERRVAGRIGVVFPDQDGPGTHVNISGAGVTASSDNVEAALRLLEFLTGPGAQRLYADGNQEYPANPEVEPSATLSGWGDFAADTLPLARMGELNRAAVMTFDRARWR